ncbi:uncharacterized protein VICG_01258 [Vittaforma corneae ATCC 50505]|uniref:Anamorsin C-terminal domain-containing protein n=1 Tax=Vittaforma corneae (strain ATCC 50505) TaxID=993615 RepID=L2GM93_VITCO|nr:uncharacterized protein VICG_01258 [Vittaforma corneae ATCC 50505]ELA41754.1 hypothetical protein VICG_01258 [Vittaforma corneae ATCC 50505]
MVYQEIRRDFEEAMADLEKVDSKTVESEELKNNLKIAMEVRVDPREAESQIIPQNNLEVQAKKRSSKKRKCANCTCGRSRNKSLETSKDSREGCGEFEVKPPKSGCGSCYLGDAFRCDGCPYKGMPAFKEGEEFKFDDKLNDL